MVGTEWCRPSWVFEMCAMWVRTLRLGDSETVSLRDTRTAAFDVATRAVECSRGVGGKGGSVPVPSGENEAVRMEGGIQTGGTGHPSRTRSWRRARELQSCGCCCSRYNTMTNNCGRALTKVAHTTRSAHTKTGSAQRGAWRRWCSGTEGGIEGWTASVVAPH